MRLGTVIGRVTLTKQEPAYEGGRLLLVQPLSREQYAAFSTARGADAASGAPAGTRPVAVPLAKGNSLVVFDHLGAHEGCIVGYTEGTEASQPFEGDAPVDAYAACIVQHIDFHPPATS